jgi:hypothetical protein
LLLLEVAVVVQEILQILGVAAAVALVDIKQVLRLAHQVPDPFQLQLVVGE